MELQQFLKQNRPVWNELDELLGRLNKNRTTLTSADIDQLNRLYHEICQHLSYSRTFYAEEEVTRYLNQLASRAHHQLHGSVKSSKNRLSHFFIRVFRDIVRRQFPFVAVAFVLFTLGFAAGFFTVWNDPLQLYVLLPEEMAEQFNPQQVGSHEDIDETLMSSSIMVNNIQVALLAFIGGITLGLWTMYVLVFNGVILGSLAALFLNAGNSYTFWAYILPHGVIELTAIFIAGSAGLHLGYRILVPGRFKRKHSLQLAAKDSALLMLGTIPMFVIAGVIEGFITPAPISAEAKYAVAGITAILLLLYFVPRFGKRSGKSEPIVPPGV